MGIAEARTQLRDRRSSQTFARTAPPRLLGSVGVELYPVVAWLGRVFEKTDSAAIG